MVELKEKKCLPCEGGVLKLNKTEITELLKSIASDWKLIDNTKITREFRFVNFVHTLIFVNKIAELAEIEGHHPELHVSYGKCVIELFTFSIKGLSENDFILAAKIDALD
jgi:4a-hydroxytetrahydrobiopterin dehydratase